MSTLFENIIGDLHPFVKWVGGKRQLLPELQKAMPSYYGRYYEPFVGGGALFFSIQPQYGYISDLNEELINLYITIRDDVEALMDSLDQHVVTKEYYIKIRNLDRNAAEYKQLSNVERASRFIYLNRTCFNGLYRVNSKGEFNVPFGQYRNPRLYERQNLLDCSSVLKTTEIQHADFANILNYVKSGDFVYFDPPYLPLNVTSSFTSYTKEGFDIDMQKRLKEVCDELNDRQVMFMLSNSDTDFINNLYADYSITKVYASRQINSVATKRGKITEVLVKNY